MHKPNHQLKSTTSKGVGDDLFEPIKRTCIKTQKHANGYVSKCNRK